MDTEGEDETTPEDDPTPEHETRWLQHAKVMSVAGAYWHGDQNSDQLTRVYGTAWADKKGLKNYLQRLEEARKRDLRPAQRRKW